MTNLASELVVLTGLAFCLWLAILSTLRGVNVPLAGVIAAVLSWAGATLSLAWTVELLQRTGHWPL